MSRGDSEDGGCSTILSYDWMEMEEHFLFDAAAGRCVRGEAARDFSVNSRSISNSAASSNIHLVRDYRYFSFQMWQEGIARYTEYRTALLASRNYQPSRSFRRLPDYQPLGEVAEQIKLGIVNDLRISQLADYKRVIFYALGAGEGLLLDRVNPRWRERYFAEKFDLNKHFPPARGMLFAPGRRRMIAFGVR